MNIKITDRFQRLYQLKFVIHNEINSSIRMKFFYLMAVCTLCVAAAMAKPQLKVPIPPPDDKINWPQLSGGGGGNPNTGYDISINAQQKVWESDDKRHTFGVMGGWGQHLGGPYGNSPADKRIGAGYQFRF